jgi:hypothetical protein
MYKEQYVGATRTPRRARGTSTYPGTIVAISLFVQLAEASIDIVLARGALPPLLYAHDSFCNFSTAYHAQPSHRTPG